MIADDGTPILMDFGSAVKARVAVENRSQALFQQVRSRFLSYSMCLVDFFNFNTGHRS